MPILSTSKRTRESSTTDNHEERYQVYDAGPSDHQTKQEFWEKVIMDAEWNMESRTLSTHWEQKLQVLQKDSLPKETQVLTAMGKVVCEKECEDSTKYINPWTKDKKTSVAERKTAREKTDHRSALHIKQKEAAMKRSWWFTQQVPRALCKRRYQASQQSASAWNNCN